MVENGEDGKGGGGKEPAFDQLALDEALARKLQEEDAVRRPPLLADDAQSPCTRCPQQTFILILCGISAGFSWTRKCHVLAWPPEEEGCDFDTFEVGTTAGLCFGGPFRIASASAFSS